MISPQDRYHNISPKVPEMGPLLQLDGIWIGIDPARNWNRKRLIPALVDSEIQIWIWIFKWDLDSGIWIKATWNPNRIGTTVSGFESNWNWNRRCRNCPITDKYGSLKRIVEYFQQIFTSQQCLEFPGPKILIKWDFPFLNSFKTWPFIAFT